MSDSSSRELIRRWFESLEPDQRFKPLPPRGSVAAALIVLESLKREFDLDPGAHLTAKGGQIKGMGPGPLRSVLALHGEHRVFLKEAGRTNRGNHSLVASLLGAIRGADLGGLVQESRERQLDEMQKYLVERIADYFNQERIKVDFDPVSPPRVFVAAILAAAENKGRADYVSQHLVGAKLALRFPKVEVSNFAGSAGDVQSGRLGDFQVGDAAFHVTISPTPAICAKCADNLRAGASAVLLVPEARLAAARELARQQGILDRIMVEPIESFVGQNMAELSEFRRDRVRTELALLVREYNRRVAAVESDKSLLIEAPAALGLPGDDAERS